MSGKRKWAIAWLVAMSLTIVFCAGAGTLFLEDSSPPLPPSLAVLRLLCCVAAFVGAARLARIAAGADS